MGTKAHSIIGMDVATVVQMLNRAYADEWLAFMQYWTAAKLVKGITRNELQKELTQHAAEEFEHADRLATRILQLGGEILKSPEEILSSANCGFIKTNDPCTYHVVEQTIASERCAIAVYKKIMDETHGKDQITYHLAMQILQEELDHEEEFQNFKEDLDLLMEKSKNFCGHKQSGAVK